MSKLALHSILLMTVAWFPTSTPLSVPPSPTLTRSSSSSPQAPPAPIIASGERRDFLARGGGMALVGGFSFFSSSRNAWGAEIKDATPTATTAGSSSSSSSSSAAALLLELIPAMPYGAPATNATVPVAVAAAIEAEVRRLERESGGRDLVRDKNLNGSWRLLYSDGREITSLARGFPGGFELGPTYQPVDVATGRFENQGSVVNRFGLAKLSTTVVGDVVPAARGTLNAVGVRNDDGNRVEVIFRRILFSLDEVGGVGGKSGPGPGSAGAAWPRSALPLRKVLVPDLDPAATAAPPANDVTFLDASARVVRGGDGALFVFRREESPRPLLSLDERAALYAEAGGVAVTTGTGVPEDSAPPELKRLLQDR